MTTSLQYIIKLNKTLEELGELIHEVQKKESSGQYLFKSVGPVIRNNLQAFFLEPLGRIRFVNPSLKGKEVESLHQERLKWERNLQNFVETTESFDLVRILKEDYEADKIPFQELVDSVCSFLYDSNIQSNVLKLDQANSSL